MEPGEILSTAGQIAVALAGFAGVVVVGSELYCCSCIMPPCSATRSFSADHMMRRSAFDTRPHPMNILPQSMKRLFH